MGAVCSVFSPVHWEGWADSRQTSNWQLRRLGLSIGQVQASQLLTRRTPDSSLPASIMVLECLETGYNKAHLLRNPSVPSHSLGCLFLCLGNGRLLHAGLLQTKTLFVFTFYLSPGYHSSATHGLLQMSSVLHTGIKKVLHSMSSENLSWLGAVRTDFQKSLCWLALALVLAPVRFLFTALAALASMRVLIISCLWRSSVLLLLLTDTFCPIQGFFNLPDFWLNNLGVAFLCLLYFSKNKIPSALLRYHWEIKWHIFTVTGSHFDTYMHCKIVKSIRSVNHYYWNEPWLGETRLTEICKLWVAHTDSG
jgi:hypothetical protein